MPSNLRICVFRCGDSNCTVSHVLEKDQTALRLANCEFVDCFISSRDPADTFEKIVLEGYDAFINPLATCHCEAEVASKVNELLKSRNQCVLLSSDYDESSPQRIIVGSADLTETWKEKACKLRYFSILAIEVHGCNLLTRPLEYDQPGPGGFSNHPHGNHHESSSTDSIQVILDVDPSFRAKISSLALARFDAYVQEPYGAARLDITVEGDFRNVAIGVNFTPAIFPYFGGPGDERLVQELPGSYSSLIALALSNVGLHIDMNDARDRLEVCRDNFNALAPIYDALFSDVPQYQVIQRLVEEYRWDNRVLDVGCGSGLFGETLKRRWPDSTVFGTDVSDGMIRSTAIEKYYMLPICVGDMEENLLTLGMFDHVACFSVFQYVDPVSFLAALAQIFCVAEKSVTFDVMDIRPEYLSLLSRGSKKRLKPCGHLESMKTFATPPGWEKVLETRAMAFKEPEFQMDIETVFYRYERL